MSKVICPYCDKEFNKTGFHFHEAKHKSNGDKIMSKYEACNNNDTMEIGNIAPKSADDILRRHSVLIDKMSYNIQSAGKRRDELLEELRKLNEFIENTTALLTYWKYDKHNNVTENEKQEESANRNLCNAD